MVEEIKTEIKLEIDNRKRNKDGTFRKKYPSKHGPAFSVRMNPLLAAKIKSLDNWQDWVRNTLEKEVDKMLDKPKEI